MMCTVNTVRTVRVVTTNSRRGSPANFTALIHTYLVLYVATRHTRYRVCTACGRVLRQLLLLQHYSSINCRIAASFSSNMLPTMCTAVSQAVPRATSTQYVVRGQVDCATLTRAIYENTYENTYRSPPIVWEMQPFETNVQTRETRLSRQRVYDCTARASCSSMRFERFNRCNPVLHRSFRSSAVS